jgi:hypothetical protein
MRLCAVNKAKGLPYDPKADGFVFSSEAIERACERWERETEFSPCLRSGARGGIVGPPSR